MDYDEKQVKMIREMFGLSKPTPPEPVQVTSPEIEAMAEKLGQFEMMKDWLMAEVGTIRNLLGDRDK